MSTQKRCVVCEKELAKPLMCGDGYAPKSWLRKEGYDGYQWREPRHLVEATFKNIKSELVEPTTWGEDKDYLFFYTCMKHTDSKFDTTGEVAEPNEDEEDA